MILISVGCGRRDCRSVVERQGFKAITSEARLTSFMNPDNDPKGSGYQIKQSLNRGWIREASGAKERSKGTQTQGDFLPIPHADFIFRSV